MKKTFEFFFALIIILFVSSCGANDPQNEDNNVLGGDTEIPLAEVGNTGYSVVEVNGQYGRIDGIEITGKENGTVNIHVESDLSQLPALEKFIDLIPQRSKDANNNLKADLKFKFTSEGIQDFIFNTDGKPHTLVKYDCKVGDTYTLKQSDGQIIKRTVTRVSDQDDFQWGMLNIKTITIEQNSIVPGVKKYIFRANHRFGLVWFEAVLEDGTSVGSYIYPFNY